MFQNFWQWTVQSGVAPFSALPPHTQIFLVFIGFLTLLFHLFYNEKAVSYAPTILTTTGIFATFVGIAVGLSEFDPNNVQGSVPALLGGLKTAIWASVAGVGGALTIKLRHYFIGVRHAESGSGSDGEVTARDLAKLLLGIQNALVGGEETSLISQLKLLRQDTNDRLDALKAAQAQALQKLSEMGSKALVEALRDVIRDFNAKITEQFGENFKALNTAVGQLLVWQQQYRTQIEATVRQNEELVGLMTKATADYSELLKTAGAFSQIAQDLGQMLRTLEDQKQQLIRVSKSLAELLQAASGSLPAVEKKVLELTTQLSSAVAENQKVVSAALTDNATTIKNMIQTSHQQLTSTNAEVNKQVSDLVAKTKEQITVLDAALSDELKRSLESLGRQLAALSEKFVSDYGPLTEKLRHIVEIAR